MKRRNGSLTHCSRKAEWYGHSRNKFLIKLHMELTMTQQLHSWAFIPGKLKHVHKNVHTEMFISTLFIIAKHCKQSKCPSMGKWLNKMQCMCITGYSSAIKRNEMLIHTT